jgi:hypothetical protein
MQPYVAVAAEFAHPQGVTLGYIRVGNAPNAGPGTSPGTARSRVGGKGCSHTSAVRGRGSSSSSSNGSRGGWGRLVPGHWNGVGGAAGRET